LAIAARLGAESINADETDPMPIIRRATGGKGADVVFESAGQPAGVALSLLAVRPRGRVCLIGTPHEPTPVHTGAVCASEIEIVGSRAHSPEGLAEAIRLIPDLQNWVHVFDFERFPLARADEALSAAEDSVNPKVLVQP
jgi:threonine dehydrogenase-like Zn-dependent dehydrogenase